MIEQDIYKQADYMQEFTSKAIIKLKILSDKESPDKETKIKEEIENLAEDMPEDPNRLFFNSVPFEDKVKFCEMIRKQNSSTLEKVLLTQVFSINKRKLSRCISRIRSG